MKKTTKFTIQLFLTIGILTWLPASGAQAANFVVNKTKAKHSVATPVNWKNGDDCIIVPAATDEQAKEKFPGGWNTVRPYLRVVKQPS